LCLSLSVAAAGQGSGWGLSYPQKGKTPVGNASAAELRELDAYYVGDPAEKAVYLTFDAGYENGQTAKILDVLKEKEVPAAFFLVGTYIRREPELTRRMAAEGHIVGNHTTTHPDMSAIADKSAFRAELEKTEAAYKEVTGLDMPKFYRPPRGEYSVKNLEMAKELGYKTVFWSLAYVDWLRNKQPSREQAFQKLIPRLHPGAVLLLHSTSQTNAEILGELIDRYREMGYTFKGLEELAGGG
jgi:peptidoglycan-N-acetylmuramic acid deacetylase